MKKSVLSLAIVALISIGIAAAAIFNTLNIPGKVNVILKPVTLKAYKDVDCTQPLTSYDWGDMHHGDLKEYLFYVRNEGEEPTHGFIACYVVSDVQVAEPFYIYEHVILPNDMMAVIANFKVSDTAPLGEHTVTIVVEDRDNWGAG